MVSKYIISGGDANAQLERMGVVNGLNGLDFGMSSFLADDRSINVVVVYQIKVKGFGFFDQTILVKQSASTAAWAKGKSLKQVEDKKANDSLWDMDATSSAMVRGKAFVQLSKSADDPHGVKPGVGVDLFDASSNTIYSVISRNIYSAGGSYAECNGDPTNPASYTIKEGPLKSSIKSEAQKLVNASDKLGDSLVLDNNTNVSSSKSDRNLELIVFVPEEAKGDKATLDKIAASIQQDTGVKVTFYYQDLALGR